jgi:hypothetical protein
VIHYTCDICKADVADTDRHNLAITKVAVGASWSDRSGAPRLEDRPACVADICGECRDNIAAQAGMKIR